MKFSWRKIILITGLFIISGIFLLYIFKQTERQGEFVKTKIRNQPTLSISTFGSSFATTESQSNVQNEPKDESRSGKTLILTKGVRGVANKSELKRMDAEVPNINSLPKVKISNSSYSLIKGLFGSISPVAGATPLLTVNGINYYESLSIDEAENVVLGPDGQVGIWTGEISVSGSANSLNLALKEIRMEIVSEGHGKIIVKPLDSFSLKDDLPALLKMVSPNEVQIDVLYSRKVRQ